MLRTRRVGYALGAEVTGVDLKQRLDSTAIGHIRNLWLEHLLLIFPGQDLQPRELRAFAEQFGELEIAGKHSPGDTELPVVGHVADKAINGRPFHPEKNGQNWHSDKSFTTRPNTATFLSCKETPPVGGDTLFANMYMAYESLSPKMRNIIDELSAVHDYELRLRTQSYRPTGTRKPGSTGTAEEEESTSSRATVHPATRIHPETQRKALFLGDRVRRFVELSEEEGQPLLDFLNGHAVSHEFTYRHRWSVNDMVMWDNRCLLHIALFDYDLRKDSRFMLRCAALAAPEGRPYAEARTELAANPR